MTWRKIFRKLLAEVWATVTSQAQTILNLHNHAIPKKYSDPIGVESCGDFETQIVKWSETLEPEEIENQSPEIQHLEYFVCRIFINTEGLEKVKTSECNKNWLAELTDLENRPVVIAELHPEK